MELTCKHVYVKHQVPYSVGSLARHGPGMGIPRCLVAIVGQRRGCFSFVHKVANERWFSLVSVVPARVSCRVNGLALASGFANLITCIHLLPSSTFCEHEA